MVLGSPVAAIETMSVLLKVFAQVMRTSAKLRELFLHMDGGVLNMHEAELLGRSFTQSKSNAVTLNIAKGACAK